MHKIRLVAFGGLKVTKTAEDGTLTMVVKNPFNHLTQREKSAQGYARARCTGEQAQ